MRRFVALRRKADFIALRRHGRRVSTPILTLYCGGSLPEDRSSLVGISVAKAIGIAVVRNKLRRRISAIVSDALAQRERLRLLVVPRPGAASAPFSRLRTELTTALNR
ncbi:MAG: ribonuclease P protein component [Candidatus Eremiobacteraeota bacterium]|nr:ribonuclease P protein component [Candidatus Eremiobacteraeota bacterium]